MTFAGRPLSARRLLWLLWLSFLLRGLFYSALQPLWEGWDEWSHYAYLEHLATAGSIPRPGIDPPSREVTESVRIGPLPWSTHHLTEDRLSYEKYWSLDPAARAARSRRRGAIPSAWRRELDQSSEPNYESQQPPLYYLALLTPLRAIGESPLASRVFWLRLASILIASASIPLAFFAARRLLSEDAAALASVACAIAMPVNLINSARVGNECLVMALYAALVLLTLRMMDQPLSLWRHLAVGGVLGAGLLTKAYFLTALPVVLLAAWLAGRRRAVQCALAAVALAILMAGWWYVSIHNATGTLTGQIQAVHVRGSTLPERIGTAFRMNWFRVADTFLLSHIWCGAASFLQVRSWMYHLLYVCFGAAVVGLAYRVRHWPAPVWVTGAFLACFCGSLAYHALVTFLITKQNMTNGWYLYALAFAETSMIGLGFGVLWNARRALAVLTSLFAALDLYGVHFHLWPHYSGLTSHRPSGSVTSFKLSQLDSGWWRLLAERTAFNQPYLDSVWMLVALWALYLLATFGVVYLAWRAAAIEET